MLSVTWSFLLSWVILFWVWPFVFRFSGSLMALARMGRAIQETPKRLLNAMRTNPLFFITCAVLLVGWQIASYVAPAGTLEHPLVPGWDYVFRVALPRMAGDWLVPGGFPLPGVTVLFDQLAPFPAILGEEARTWPAVFLALAFHSFMTLSRLVLGLFLGLLGGLATGLVISYWSILRQISWTSMNFLRMIPLLAAIPWMQFALGATLRGLTTFIAFGVWVVLVVATMNSVANVPDRYIESARTLGASRMRTYFKVIIPGSMPELRTALLLSAGLGWSLTIAAEFLGFSHRTGIYGFHRGAGDQHRPASDRGHRRCYVLSPNFLLPQRDVQEAGQLDAAAHRPDRHLQGGRSSRSGGQRRNHSRGLGGC